MFNTRGLQGSWQSFLYELDQIKNDFKNYIFLGDPLPEESLFFVECEIFLPLF